MSITTPMKRAAHKSAESEIFERVSVDDVVSMLAQAELLSHERHLVMQCLSGDVTMVPTDLHRPLLILDVRLCEEYARGHILSAINYPHTNLSRNIESSEMLEYKNRPGHIIVCYDDSEHDAPRVVSTLIQRGYDNVLLMTHGLSHAAQHYPAGLITSPVDVSKSTGRPLVPVPSQFTRESLAELQKQLDKRLGARRSRGVALHDNAYAKS